MNDNVEPVVTATPSPDAATPAPGEADVSPAPQETFEVVGQERPFLSTPFTDYSVQEGLSLLIFLALVFAALWGIVKEAF